MRNFTFLISMPGGSAWILILLAVLAGAVVYFLPTIIASNRKHPNSGPILVLNLLAGWTFLGWIGALIWALTIPNAQNTTVVVNNAAPTVSQVHPNQTSAAPAGAATHQDKIDQLKQLKQLLDDGILTPEEFNKQKQAILG
jgi:hypothetical protein